MAKCQSVLSFNNKDWMLTPVIWMLTRRIMEVSLQNVSCSKPSSLLQDYWYHVQYVEHF